MDATLIRADVSWESLSTEHAQKVLEENDEETIPKKPRRPRTHPTYPKKHSTTDPDATMATSRKDQRLEPSYKQHTTVDDKAGVIVDVELTTGEVNEGKQLIEGLSRVEVVTGIKVQRVTADGSYAHPSNYEAMEARGTEAIIPPMGQRRKFQRIPLMRFSYNGRQQVVICPAGKRMERSSRAKQGWIYRANARDCQTCLWRSRCIPPTAQVRTVCIVDSYEALLRARRHWSRWDEETWRWYQRHRWQVEGVHGEAKTQHGLRRAVRRGLVNVAIQVYLTAAVINLKRLVALLSCFLWLKRRRFCPQLSGAF